MDLSFEDILEQVGGYGKHQKYSTAFFLIPSAIALAIVSINALFMVSVPEHWCYVKEVASSNLSVSEQRALVSPPEDPSCSMFDVNYTEYLSNRNHTWKNDTPIILCKSGWEYDDSEYESTATTKWNLVCEHRYLPSFILTLQNVGSLLLTPLYGFLADRCGRKRIYLVLVALTGLADLGSVLSTNFTIFAILRVLHGSTEPTAFSLAFILLIETVSSGKRADINGVINTFWTFGFCILPLIAYLCRNWINLGLVSAAISVLAVAVCKFVPESPSWLISRGRYEEATSILEKIARTNGKNVDRVHIFNELQTLGRNCQKQKDTTQNSSSYQMFKFPRIRRHFFILSVSWAAFYVTYFGFMYNLRNLSGNEFFNFFLLCVVEIPGNILFWILLNKAGRRWTTSLGFITLGFICLGPLTGFAYSDIICSMIGKLLSTGLFMTTDQQGTELFPTVSRSFAINLGKTVSNGISLVVPFFADLGEENKNLPFLIMACVSVASGVLTSFLPESLNESLPQTMLEAEALGKDQKFFSWKSYKNPVASKASSTLHINTLKAPKCPKEHYNENTENTDNKTENEDIADRENGTEPMVKDSDLKMFTNNQV